MTTRTILEKTAELLNLTVDFSVTGNVQSALLSCCRYILGELTTQYEELLVTETVEANDKKIYYDNLSKKPVHVLSVVKSGKKVRFRLFPTCIKVDENGAFDVTYSYRIDSPTLTDTVTLPPKYNEETLSWGVAAEYLHRTGYDSDAAFYSNRYYTALKNLSISRKDIVLPTRRYL